MRKRLWLLGLVVLLLALALPVSAEGPGPMRFEAPGSIFIVPSQPLNFPCQMEGDLYAFGDGQLLDQDGDEVGAYQFWEVLKIKQANAQRVLSQVIEGKMIVTFPNAGDPVNLEVNYCGPSVQKLTSPFGSPYGPAWIRWVGQGKVARVAYAHQNQGQNQYQNRYHYRYERGNFTWKGFVLAETDEETGEIKPLDITQQPISFVGWMRFNPRGKP